MATTTSAARNPVRPGATGPSATPEQIKYVAIGLVQVPLVGLVGIPLYLRTAAGANDPGTYKLLCNEATTLTAELRTRIVERGVNAVHVPESFYAKFLQQVEPALLALSKDAAITIAARAELIYSTAVEFVSDLIRGGDLSAKLPRLELISRAMTSLVAADPAAFMQTVPPCRNDLYTASHSVAVGAGMVRLAAAMGTADADKLNAICQGGLLHDIGTANIPVKVLNTTGMLSAPEWDAIRGHPNAGVELMKKCTSLDPVVRTVTKQHHERMNGTGYPQKMKAEQIDPMGRLCAVVDSYIAMTSARPFRKLPMGAEQAIKTITAEAPAKYDAAVVKAWGEVLVASKQVAAAALVIEKKRGATRFRIDCPVKLHILMQKDGKWTEKPGFAVKGLNISKTGVGISSPTTIAVGDWVRVILSGAGTLNRTCEGFVARCQPCDDGSFEIGIHFGPLPGQEEAPVAKVA